jgi:hypothetical protein
MDRPVLQPPVLAPLVRELGESDRLRAFVEALPARARVSEPALPLLLAALREMLGRSLLVLLPEDADARDAAEAAGSSAPRRPLSRRACRPRRLAPSRFP